MFPPRKIERKKDQIKSKVSRRKEIKIKAKKPPVKLKREKQ